ncbi:MAG: beta-aspartyl-peptidase [Aquimonas sp.]|nr:beta-aspartyl-peptidase [Aquimonas sp.]
MMLLAEQDSPLLIRDVEVFAPQPLGRRDVLIAAGRVLAIESDLVPGTGFPLRRIEGRGRWLLPGLVDSLVHIGGGGGEGGFATRAEPLRAQQAFEAGVTTLIGALGTDEVTRSHADLLACARALSSEGLSAYVLSGSYRVPVATLTGCLRRDLVLIPEMIGAGEIAIADHRGSQPSAAELARIGADARVGGMLAGKRGTVLIHVGDAPEGLRLLHEVSDTSALPVWQWHPTHINRNRPLFEQGIAWVTRGGSIDLTASTTPELLASGELPAADALLELLRRGAPVERITLSSDGQASLPHFDEQGRLLSLEVAPLSSLLDCLRALVIDHGQALQRVLPAFTRSPAELWGLPRKGRIEVGADADLLLLDSSTMSVEVVVARGSCHRLRIT